MTFDKGIVELETKLADGTTLHVWDKVSVPKHLQQRLSAIQSTLSFKWDRWYRCWNVVHAKIGQVPYIVMTVTNPDNSYRPIDDRTFEQIRKSIWWSTEGIARQARKMQNNAEHAKAKLNRELRENNRDFAKEMAYPVMNVLRGNSEWNRQSNFMFAGYGESKRNA